jgi:nucleoid-associated protein YgaU
MYQVRPGDSLWKIAQSHLGDGYKWPIVYRANRKSLKNTNTLSVGQMLVIPAQ